MGARRESSTNSSSRECWVPRTGQNHAMSCSDWKNWTTSSGPRAQTPTAERRRGLWRQVANIWLLTFRERLYFPPMSSGVHSDPEQWSDPRHQRGLAGEEQAIRFLQSRGWDILAHRYRVGRIEIDLIARRGALVAFIEVKARRGLAFG